MLPQSCLCSELNCGSCVPFGVECSIDTTGGGLVWAQVSASVALKLGLLPPPHMNHSEVINTSAKQTIQLHPGQHFQKNELP